MHVKEDSYVRRPAATASSESLTVVDVSERRFDATPLDTALWSWNNAADGEGDKYYEAVAALARAGARFDRGHCRDAAVLDRIAGDARMQAALRGEQTR